jgi:hypothetical protein
LQRLDEAGEVKAIKASTGKVVAYQWITEMEKALPRGDASPKYGFPDPLNQRGKAK